MSQHDSQNETQAREYGMASAAGLRLKANMKAMVAKAPAMLVQGTARMLGLLRDAVRIAQYDVGPPFIYTQQIIIQPNTTGQFAVNIPQDGTVRSFRWVLTNIGADAATAPLDVRMFAGVTSVGIASQLFFSAEDNAFVQFAGGPTSFGPGVFNGHRGQVGLAGATGLGMAVNSLTASLDGFARRINVAEGTSWKVGVTNQSPNGDRYQMMFVVEQYWRDKTGG